VENNGVQLTSTLKKETVGYSETLGTASKTTTRCHNSEVRSTHFHRRENLNIVHLYPVCVNIRCHTAATSGRIVYIRGFSPKKPEQDRKSVSLYPPISFFVIRVAASKRFPLQKCVSTFCVPQSALHVTRTVGKLLKDQTLHYEASCDNC
jgi:hypothetical protein